MINFALKSLRANTANEVLEITQTAGIDLAAPVAKKARRTALDTLCDMPVSVDLMIVDREGNMIANEA